jgi:hypothetical protein
MKQELGDTVKTEAELETLAKTDQTLIKEHVPVVKTAASICGNCFGAGSPGQCCETCDEVNNKLIFYLLFSHLYLVEISLVEISLN